MYNQVLCTCVGVKIVMSIKSCILRKYTALVLGMYARN